MKHARICMFKCALGYGNPTKVARSNQQKRTYTTSSKGMFLLIATCHLSRVTVAQGTEDEMFHGEDGAHMHVLCQWSQHRGMYLN